MLLYTAVAAITILLACFVVNKPAATAYGTTRRQALSGACLVAIFVILFALAAMRINVGNDYKNYAITAHEVWVDGYVVTEPGFNLLVKVLYTLAGWENYVLLFAVFAFVTIFLYMKIAYEQSYSFALAFFLFMMLGMYFRTFNTVRYYFVLAVALYALRYVVNKQYIRFLLCILAASFFHKSVLVVIPIYLAAVYVSKKWHYIALGICGFIFLLAKDLVMKIALILYPSYENTSYINEVGILSGWISNANGIIRCLLVLVLCLIFYKDALEDNRANKVYFNLNVFAVILYVFGVYLPLLSRFTYYLMGPQILLIPGVISCIKDEKKKKWVTAIVLTIGILYFVLFMRGAYEEGLRILPYKSWIFGIEDYIYANEIN